MTSSANTGYLHRGHWLIPIVLLTCLFALCLSAILGNGQIVDETFYNGSGYPMVRYHRYDILGEHPPLIMQLASLPLLFMNVTYGIEDPIYINNTKGIDISQMGSRFLYKLGNNPETILLAERLVVTLLTLLLGYFLYRWASELFGWKAAAVSLTLFCFSPDIITLGSLFMTDLGVTCFMFIAIYYLYLLLKSPSAVRAVQAGFATGLALMSKLSALALIPITLILFMLVPWLCPVKEGDNISTSRRLDVALVLVAVALFVFSIKQGRALITLGPLCLLALWMVILPSLQRHTSLLPLLRSLILLSGIAAAAAIGWKLNQVGLHVKIVGGTVFLMLTSVALALLMSGKQAEDPFFRDMKLFVLIWFTAAFVIIFGHTDFLVTLPKLEPFRHYVRTLNISLAHITSQHDFYLGDSFIKPNWTFFIALMLIKIPVAVWLLFAVGLYSMIRSRLPLRDKMFLTLPPFIYWLLASFANQVYNGVRHVLPIYMFIFLNAGCATSMVEGIKAGWVRKIGYSILVVLLGWTIGRTVGTDPYYATYFNEFVGSPEAAARLVPVNGGQNNRHLAQLVKQLNIPSIKVASTQNNLDEYEYYDLPLEFPKDGDLYSPEPGFYALDIDTYVAQQKDPASWFYKKRPDHMAGNIFYVFKVAE